jgi:hypothetical protein
LGLYSEQSASSATVSQVADTIRGHPTLAEGMIEAVEDAEDRAIHQLKKKSS